MIYIHVPFCHRKCTYCAFYSKPVGGRERVTAYVDALIAEMRMRRGEQAHPVRTVYFGGGTPSILSLEDLERVAVALRECFDLSQLEEVTLEANPEDLTLDYLRGLRDMGLVNRLSIGIQSLDDEMLRLIGRRHTASQALAAVAAAHAVGFHNLSVDFIYGLPRESRYSDFDFRLVSHLSAYALTVEPGTALAVMVERGRVSLPGDDAVVEQYHTLRRLFAERGFAQYEVSNYARLDCHSRHNSRYWDRTPYLGLGPGAHSFDGLHRRWNEHDIDAYIKNLTGDTLPVPPPAQQETLTLADTFNELLMTSLRTVRGLALAQVPTEYREGLHRGMQPFIKQGWIEYLPSQSTYRPTAEGLLQADGMAAALFV